MISLIALLASILILSVVVLHVRFIAPVVRERALAQSIALGRTPRMGKHRAVRGIFVA